MGVMENNLIESKSVFSFHLDGASEIDAALLSKTIRDMAELAKLASCEENPDAYLKMNVTAFKNGSFQIDFSAVCKAAQDLLSGTGSAADLANKVIAALKGIFEIKKMLKGQRPKSVEENGENITVENANGEKVIAPKSSGIVVNNIKVDQLVVNISTYAQEHSPDGGFTIQTSDGAVSCESDDIKEMVKPLPIEEDVSSVKRYRIRTSLPIRKAVFVGNSKWTFEYNEKGIDASITDDEFINDFQKNESIRTGDYIDAMLEIYIDLDLQGDPIYGTEKYTVTKVYGGIQHSNDGQEELNI